MFEMMVAMDIGDEEAYSAYRAGMSPILKSFGGRFRYDFKVSEALQREATHPINRVFALNFPDRISRDAFFSNPDYKKVRSAYFEQAVKARTLIAEYDL
ncbi:MAG TPA: DUF1330 domain-containing protein [Leptospiraceae bacterium]|nr:DUF1330 domain-containing protein [Leptospiraceae bacterium]HNE24086.1 DUF1330 domain-containing protein [Leptospiraceae bacterium]HNJ34137.1 DUF1330 domain-containing protein [Leptospiraceae bacterium]